MNRMRLAMCVAVFAMIGGIAVSQDMDISALQAKLAAQEARLNDLQAKMNQRSGGSEAVGVTSIRKNAVVTIGGTINTRMWQRDGKLKTSINNDAAAGATGIGASVQDPNGYWNRGTNANYLRVDRYTARDFSYQSLEVSDANLNIKIDVNDYFDAFLRINGHDSAGRDNVSGVAAKAWVRWKNVCNTGFGLKIGRDDLVFGGGKAAGAGMRAGYTGGYDDLGGTVNDWGGLVATTGQWVTPAGALVTRYGDYGEGMFVGGSWLPTHTGWDWGRTTQITPYWESRDGKWKFELSFFQAAERRTGTSGNSINGPYGEESKMKSINGGPVSVAARVTAKPIEGLSLVASAVNFYTNQDYATIPHAHDARKQVAYLGDGRTSSSNTAVNFMVEYRPCFFNRMNIWAQYNHGWNEGWVKDMDSDVLDYGVSFRLTEQIDWFGQGSYMKVKNDHRDVLVWHKATAWQAYTGFRYKLPYGANVEVGYKHEVVNFKDRQGFKHTKATSDSIYGHLGFDF